jgi:hemolysin activation/secretion protein
VAFHRLLGVPGLCWWLAVFSCLRSNGGDLPVADTAAGLPGSHSTNYNVRAFAIAGKSPLAPGQLLPLLDRHTGTNVSLQEIIQAALDLQAEYRRQGFPTMRIGVAPGHSTNGIVTMTVVQGAFPELLISGKPYPFAGEGGIVSLPFAGARTNAPAATNATPHFAVDGYEVLGNHLLAEDTLQNIFAKHVGTNLNFEDIVDAAKELQEEYHDRGFDLVRVTIPQQRLTNDLVKVVVFEGVLASIQVRDNHYFNSNNVMRALPSLRTNMILNTKVFQAELDRANANQDRKIYPQIEAGPDPGTSELILKVKDRPPLHAKLELNNDNSPGTPDLRVNASLIYANLWQQEQSLGLQYSFSPEFYKQPTFTSQTNSQGMYQRGESWKAFDLPLVANYSGFYRIPLGSPASIEEMVEDHPGSFGYDEGTRKFNLPPASGRPDLTFFASRSTIDTGLQTTSSSTLVDETNQTVTQNTVQEDLTVNNDLAARLSVPLEVPGGFQSDVSGGIDFKTYQITSVKTNSFVFTQINLDAAGNPIGTNVSTLSSPVPTTQYSLEYLPLSGHIGGSWRDSLGMNTLGLGLGVNIWYSGSRSNLQSISGSPKSTGHWVVLNPSYSRSLEFVTNWVTLFRADGQWASEPLIANEQFGIGGVNSVRGYQEGQVFGDTGWHVSLEQQTPPHTVGYFYQGTPLTIRGSIYMDYADAYLLDPQGHPASTALWGTGLGGVAGIGSYWEARFLLSWPLLKTVNTGAYAPFFNFSLTAQF